MASILKSDQWEFKENPNKIDHFRLFTDISWIKKWDKPFFITTVFYLNYFSNTYFI